MEEFNCLPLHAQVLRLINQLPNKYYTLCMDNLYMSTKLCCLAYSMPQKVMVHGVTRPTKRGIPPVIKQEEVSWKEDLKQAWNTVKAAVLQGDQVCTDLVCVSIYDTKPVYFLSNVVEGIEWIEKKRKVFDPKSGRTKEMKFH